MRIKTRIGIIGLWVFSKEEEHADAYMNHCTELKGKEHIFQLIKVPSLCQELKNIFNFESLYHFINQM